MSRSMQKQYTYILYTLCCDCSHNFSSTISDCIPKLLYSVSLYCFTYPCMFYSIFICRRLVLFGGVHHLFYQSTQTSKKGCLLVFIIITVIALILFIFVFIRIIILVGEHRNSGGILSFVGSLGPPVLLSAIGYIGNKALKLLNIKTKEDSNKRTADKNKDDTASDNNLVIRHQEMSYESSVTGLHARQSTFTVTHPL